MIWDNRRIINYIKQYTEGHRRTLDIGCGQKDYSVVSDNIVTLDAWEKVCPDIVLDLEVHDLPFEENSFQCVLMIDFIEHLPKQRGIEILEQAKKITSGRIYIFTPLEFDDNTSHAHDPTSWVYGNHYYNSHKSLWSKEDFGDFVTVPSSFNHPSYFGYWEKK